MSFPPKLAVNMSDKAAALRAKRRRERILMNSEDRMKKIFGGDNYHENHLTITDRESNDLEEQSVQLTPGQAQACSKTLPKLNTTTALPSSQDIGQVSH